MTKLKYKFERAANYNRCNRLFNFGSFQFTIYRSQYRISVFDKAKGTHSGAEIWHCPRTDIQPALTAFKKWLQTSEYNK